VGCNGDFSTYAFDENRSACSCNGLIGHLDRRDCFSSPGSSHGYYSSRAWAADSIYFRNTPGPYYKNDWHFIEAYFELNTIDNGIGIPNGKIRYWYDGQILIYSDSILLRTGAHPDMMFNQLFYGGYIGVGSPVDQTWWVDDLTLANGILNTKTKDVEKDDFSFSVYPNPSNGEMNIRAITSHEGKITLTVFDMFGKKVLENIYFDHSIQLSTHLSSGLYILQLIDKKGHLFSKRVSIH